MDDIVKQRGPQSVFQDDRGGAGIYPSAIVGIVKNNVDPLRSGKIQVYLNRLNTADDDNPLHWTTISYMSPFFGYTPNTGSPTDDGSYISNPNSYGFWATPPDIGTEVVCVFINGDPNFGYYIGAIPKEGLTHMVPAVGASGNIIPNKGEADSYGGATVLPVTEYNNANKTYGNSVSEPYSEPRPIHSYQAAILNKQGLIRDPDRGPISSSSQRESPSRVFGMSTPGRPIYKGGYTDSTIGDAIKDESIPDQNFSVITRQGGHSFVMDDGDVLGRDQLLRLRTASGHMILMNDSAQTLFIIHANGQSYIELGKEGSIDMFSTNSVNIRTQGDLNLHADRNININAKKDLNISATNIKTESIETTTHLTGTDFSQQTKGKHTLKVNDKMTFASKGDSMIKSGGTNYIKGSPNVHLNTGESSLTPESVKQLPIITHTDTLYDEKKGYIPSPGYLSSIVSRAPAHSPWANAGQGVDVSINASAAAALPAEPSNELKNINDSTTGAPNVIPTSDSLAATVPPLGSASSALSNLSTSSLVSQMAVNAATSSAGDSISNSSMSIVNANGTKMAVVGSLGLNPSQLSSVGLIKPGAEVAINKAIAEGATLAQAMPPNVFTGKDGITSLTGLATNTSAQAGAATSLLTKSQSALTAAGVITGKESAGQIGGLVLSGATAGMSPTLDAAKNAISNAGAPGASLSGGNGIKAAIGAGLLLAKSLNPLSGVTTAISSGNLAAKGADKLGGVTVDNDLRGVAAGAFSKIKDTFKALVPNKPQNLTVAKAEATAPAAVVATASTTKDKLAGGTFDLNATLTNALGVGPGGPVKSAIESLGGVITGSVSAAQTPEQKMTAGLSAVTGASSSIEGLSDKIPGIPGGQEAISNLISMDPANPTPAQAGSLQSIIKGITGSANPKDALSSVNSLSDKKGGITGLASTGLSLAAAADLQGSISSLGSGSGVDVKVPTVATDTFDFSGIMAQSKSLFGNDLIPPMNLGAIMAKPITAESAKKYDTLKAELKKQEDLQWDLRKVYFDKKAGLKDAKSTQSEVDAAEAEYKACLQKIQSIRQEMSQV